MSGKPDTAPDWRGKIYDEATHQWVDAEPALAAVPEPTAEPETKKRAPRAADATSQE